MKISLSRFTAWQPEWVHADKKLKSHLHATSPGCQTWKTWTLTHVTKFQMMTPLTSHGVTNNLSHLHATSPASQIMSCLVPHRNTSYEHNHIQSQIKSTQLLGEPTKSDNIMTNDIDNILHQFKSIYFFLGESSHDNCQRIWSRCNSFEWCWSWSMIFIACVVSASRHKPRHAHVSGQ